MKKGKLIVLDGLDGCGKSTQLELAVGFLKEQGIDCRSISFPNYTTITGQVVESYLNGEIPCDNTNGAYAAASMYAIDRYVSYVTDWKNYYLKGGTVITGRYTTSNAVYQLTKVPFDQRDIFLEWIYKYEYDQLGLPRPDAVLFLDMPVAVSQKLLEARYAGDESRKDIHESNIGYLERCRENAMYVARRGKWDVIKCAEDNAPLPIEDIYMEICARLRLLLFDDVFDV